ncbi:hypothetical protein LVD17_03000 [Fulvivirga ulvae]|uniref:hypothetical protein n=1 Tax=Fulvivirga ulvae TaxID=2904245 RepID=UPI001F3C2D6A|nr:hypothetical protein [Fulvivirga ulvae]UII32800.1 hypothetical protein LVD17_03000 [Fulvivirga ulvae]
MENVNENKYKEGDIVYEKTNPDVKLVVRRYLNRIYYCKFQDDAGRKELALYEREIGASPAIANPDY